MTWTEAELDPGLKIVCSRPHEPLSEPRHYIGTGLPGVWLRNGYRVSVRDDDDCIAVRDLDGLWRAIAIVLAAVRFTDNGERRFMLTLLGDLPGLTWIAEIVPRD